jgi:hypothetical protein
VGKAPKFPLGSIEGERILINAQRISPAGTPFYAPGFNKPLFQFKTKLKSRGIINRAFVDLKARFCPKSKVKTGEGIQGSNIWACGVGFGDIGRGGGGSGKHPRQSCMLTDGALAAITVSSYGPIVEIDLSQIQGPTPIRP